MRKISRRLTHLAAWLLLFALTLIGWRYWHIELHPYETTDNAYLKTHLIPIVLKSGGILTEVTTKDNQVVKKGDVLAVIDDREPRAKMAQAEARVLADQVRLQTMKRQLASPPAMTGRNVGMLSALEPGVRSRPQRRSMVAPAGQPHDEMEPLADLHAEDLFEPISAAGERLDNERTSSGGDDVSTTRIAELDARLKADEASLELARIEMENTLVRAPADGTIGKLSVQEGQLSRPGSVFAFLIPRGLLWIEANYKEVQIERIKPGQPASIRVDALPSRVYSGTVESIAPAAGAEFSILPPENASGNFTKIVRRVTVRILFDPENDLNTLKPGLSASVKVRVE